MITQFVGAMLRGSVVTPEGRRYPTVREHSLSAVTDDRRSEPGAKRAPTPGNGQARARQVALRRRRAAALGVVAVVALAAGLIVGAVGAGGRSHRRSVASREVGFLRKIKSLAGDGSHSIAAEQRAQDDAAIDRTMSYTPAVMYAGSQHREVALTFDDGPGPYTLRLLRVLRRMHTPGTFFVVGVAEQYFHAGTTAIAKLGYPIGDHTWSHPDMAQLSRAQQQSQLMQETRAIHRYGAPFPRMFRPPYGDWNATTLSLLRKDHMLMVLWSLDTDDWQLPGAATIVHRVLHGAKPGSIVLMHDAGGDRSETIAALPKVIRGLRARGYKLVTVPQLLHDNPAPKHQNFALLDGAGG
jgi:peptidoglycan/xylan/chitin deacetylase (PgdA/CDA1 family)